MEEINLLGQQTQKSLIVDENSVKDQNQNNPSVGDITLDHTRKPPDKLNDNNTDNWLNHILSAFW